MPAIEMAHAVASYQAILFTLQRLDDAAARGPSLLPGWTRAHVVAHLARNAESHVRLLEAAMRGELVPQYPGGAEGRAHEIELAARSPAAELVDDFRRAGEELFGVWERMPVQLWDVPTAVATGSRAARATVWARWRELEVHHVDLDLGFTPQDWPRAFVEAALPRVVTGLPERRRDGAGVQSASWLLDGENPSGSWTVVVRSSRTEVRPVGSDDAHDLTVRGPAWALLFWLLGRATLNQLRDLTVVGDAGLAAALPVLHPYP